MYYKKLDIDNFKQIQIKIVSYILNFVEKSLNESEKKYSERVFFNFISDDELEKIKQDLPDLFDCIRKELNSEIVYMSFVYVDKPNSIPIHTDGDNSIDRRIRLHWPILNETSAETVYYKTKSENIESTHHSFKSGVNGQVYNSNDVYEVDRYILDVPTLNNVKEIHGIEILNNKLPRILLSMRLSNEEEVYQKFFK